MAGDFWHVLRQDAPGGGREPSQTRHGAFVAADGRAAVLAVAHGRGPAPHLRGDLGARWAVAEFGAHAESFAWRVVNEDGAAGGWQRLHAMACALARRCARGWRRRVARHDSNAPADGRGLGTGRPTPVSYEVYGTTLLGAVITARLLVCWQLGPGGIAVVWEDGRRQAPLSAETADPGPDGAGSLARADAWLRTRVHWQPLADTGPPPAVLLATDGLVRGRSGVDRFLGFAGGVCDRVACEGTAAVQRRAARWLRRAAAHSGADAALVGAFPVGGPVRGAGDPGAAVGHHAPG